MATPPGTLSVSILSGIDASRVEDFPFPHVVVTDAVEGARCLDLVRAFPPLATFTEGRPFPGHKKILRRSAVLLADERTPEIWRQAIAENLGAPAWREMVRLLGPAARREYPRLERRFGLLERFRVGQRFRDDASSQDVLLDAQLGVHTPASEAGAERGPHVKGPKKLFEAQWFLRQENDPAEGADLVLFAARPGAQLVCGPRNQVDPARLEPVKSYPYERNLLIAFLNTPRSVQAIRPRGSSPLPLQFAGFLAQLADPLFSLEPEARSARSRNPGSLR